MLSTNSAKSALFFFVAAMTIQQKVIVVVPFAALVDDIVILQYLIVVGANRAVQGELLHYAKDLELSEQLAHAVLGVRDDLLRYVSEVSLDPCIYLSYSRSGIWVSRYILWKDRGCAVGVHDRQDGR